MNGFLYPFCLLTFTSLCHLTHRSFCSQGLPGVAESTFHKAKENLHLWEEEAWQGRWGVCESILPRPSPIFIDGPTSPGGCGFIHVSGFCDFALGFAQNDRGGRHPVKMEGLELEEPKKGSLALWYKFYYWCQVHCFLLIHLLSIDLQINQLF